MAKYAILDAEMYDFISHDRFLYNDYKWNLDKTKFVVKYVGAQPTFISGYQEYTNDEIIVIVNNIENGWVEEDPTMV